MAIVRCRYCGITTCRDDLQCDDCAEYEPRLPLSDDELRHEVARWSIQVEGLTHHRGRKIVDMEIRGGLL